MASPRVAKTYTLSLDAVNALEAHAAKTGDKLSRLVEQGIRLVCALPAEPREDEGESELADTRSTKVVREVLVKMGPGPWPTTEIARQARLSPDGADKALGELERKGEVHLWGRGGLMLNNDGKRKDNVSGNEFGPKGWAVDDTRLCWDLQSPLDRVGELVAKWKACGGERGSNSEMTIRVLMAIEVLVLSIDDVEPVLSLLTREFGPLGPISLEHDAFGERRMENAKQRLARESAERKARREALEVEERLERQQVEAKHKAQEARNAQMDAEARKSRMPPPPPPDDAAS